MANCSNCNGCSGRGCTRVGALGTLCRTGCRNPYYTGPCPPAPCTDHCGNCTSNGCGCCRCRRNAQTNSCSSCGCDNGCNHCGHDHCCKHCGCHGGCSDTGCGCNHCACDDCDDCDDCDRRRGRDYGVFALSGPVSLCAGGAVEFSPCDVNPDCFACKKGCIVLRRPGLYRATLTADIPRFTEVDTALRLERNGKAIPAAEINVEAGECASAMNYTADAIFEADAGDQLKIRITNAVNIDCTAGRNVFRLTLYRI